MYDYKGPYFGTPTGDLFCHNGYLFDKDGEDLETEYFSNRQPCKICNDALWLRYQHTIMENKFNKKIYKWSMCGETIFSQWEELVSDYLHQHQKKAEEAIYAMGKIDIEDEITGEKRSWPWPVSGMSNHLFMKTMAKQQDLQDQEKYQKIEDMENKGPRI